MLKAQARESRRGTDQTRHRRGTDATWPGCSHRLRQLDSTHSPENTELCDRDVPAAARWPATSTSKPVEQFYDDPPRACSCRTATSRASCPNCGTRGPVRRLVRELRHRNLHARRSQGSDLDAVAARSPCGGNRSITSSALPHSKSVEFLRCGSTAAPVQAQRRAQARGVVLGRRGAQGLGHLARRALLRLRDPRCAGQVLLRLVRRARSAICSLKIFTRLCARTASLEVRGFPRSAPSTELHPLHRQGHHCISIPCSGRRCSRPPDMRRPTAVHAHGFVTINGAEDVEVARHVHHRAALSRII